MMSEYKDGSGPDNCQCDGADDAMYICEYHQHDWNEEPAYRVFAALRIAPYCDLADAYGADHYKSGVYDVC